MDLKRAENLKNEADKIIKKFIYIGSNRYEDASEKYNAASNIYKAKKEYQNAIQCMNNELGCYIKLNDAIKINQIHINLGNIYKNLDKEKSLYYFSKVEKYYDEIGKFEKLVKIYGEMASIYEDINNYEKAVEYFKKASEILQFENQKLAAVRYYEKIVDIYILTSKYSDAAQTLQNIIELMCDQKSYFSTKYIFKYLVCQMVLHSQSNEMEYYTKELDKVTNVHTIFNNSSEQILLQSLQRAYVNNNNNEYSRLLKEYDYYKKLDHVVVKLFLDIKKELDDINNLHEELDLT